MNQPEAFRCKKNRLNTTNPLTMTRALFHGPLPERFKLECIDLLQFNVRFIKVLM